MAGRRSSDEVRRPTRLDEIRGARRLISASKIPEDYSDDMFEDMSDLTWIRLSRDVYTPLSLKILSKSQHKFLKAMLEDTKKIFVLSSRLLLRTFYAIPAS
jgi:hypothetical protein